MLSFRKFKNKEVNENLKERDEQMNIRDIAKLAGVSVSTVSKVMNGKDKDISEKTKQKVLKVVEEEQYVPYLKYREKEGLKSHVIGLVIKKDNREGEQIIRSSQRAAAEEGYGLLIQFADNLDEIQKCVNDMIRKKVAGLLLDSKKLINTRKLEDATVYLNQTKEFDERQKATFYYRLSEAGRMAAERLMREGHEKIACITLADERTIQDGYRMAMREANLAVQPLWVYEGKNLEEIEQYGIQQCLGENVSAVICGSQEIAGCFYKTLERLQISLPDSISMISIGDGKWMEILGDGITAVRLPAQEMSREAVISLVKMIQGEKQIEVMRKFSPSIIERGSVNGSPKEKEGERIVVVGSMNMDITIEVSRIPLKGETQLAERVYTFPGGKGGNQAVGAGKLGGRVYMIGCVGNDIDGKQLYSNLMENHVHMDGVLLNPSVASGKAYINVDQDGESTIVVYQGANRLLSIEQINRCRYLFQNAKYCLLSLEIPEMIAEYTIKFCRRNNVEVILKPSAVEKIKEELLKDIAYFIPNENELNTFIPGRMSLEEKAQILREKGVENVIVTLGERGCYLRNQEYSMYFEGTGFEAVDTTGGADSFISALAVYLSEGMDLIRAIGFAVYASGISVTRYGVQPALPDRKALEIYKDEIYSRYQI